MRFACSFAWADGEIQPQERDFLRRMMARLELAPDGESQVEEWLQTPPRREQVDPTLVPAKHAWIFLETMRNVIAADDVVDPQEQALLSKFELFVTRSQGGRRSK